MQTFFVDASMQAYFGSRRFGAVDVNIMTDIKIGLNFARFTGSGISVD